MSLVEDARVVVLIADFINSDATGKLNAIGANFSITGVGPMGLSPPQSVAVMVAVPRKYAGQDIAVSIELRDDTVGDAVKVTGPAGKAEPLRIQQIMRAEVPAGIHLPPHFPCRMQAAITFGQGLPVVPGHDYVWRVELDGQHRKDWEAAFHVLAPPPQPVFGGPAGPADIPNIPKI